MFILGAGVGMIMQNLVLVVQNTVEIIHLGVATSTVTFFRSLGGTIGVSVMGSVLGTLVAQYIRDGTATLSPANQVAAMQTLGDGTIPQVSLLTIALLPNISLGTMTGIDRERSAADTEPTTGQILVSVSPGSVALPPNSPRSASVEFDRDGHYARERSSYDNGYRTGSGRRANGPARQEYSCQSAGHSPVHSPHPATVRIQVSAHARAVRSYPRRRARRESSRRQEHHQPSSSRAVRPRFDHHPSADDDGRIKYFALTPLAEAKLAEVRANDSARILSRLRGWPADDLTHFAEFLARLNTPD
jgi:hypothetical protein